jgi:hypothetical protein
LFIRYFKGASGIEAVNAIQHSLAHWRLYKGTQKIPLALWHRMFDSGGTCYQSGSPHSLCKHHTVNEAALLCQQSHSWSYWHHPISEFW